MKIHFKTMVATVILVTTLRGLYQDILGVDKYCALIRSGWVDWKISVPLTILLLFLLPLILKKP